MTAWRRPPLETLLDVALYAPIGVAAVLGDEIPRRCAQRRRSMGEQLTFARFVGEMAVKFGRHQLATRSAPEAPVTTAVEPSEAVADLTEPFAGYTTMAAAHIVARLDQSNLTEVHLVGQFEAATRHRTTILAKVAQIVGAG